MHVKNISPRRARLFGWIVVGAMSATLAACGSGGAASPAAPSPVVVVAVAAPTVTSVTVTSTGSANPTFQLAAAARLSDGNTVDVTQTAAWDSSNPLFATVSARGFVTVQASGEVDLRATYGNMSGSTRLVVARVVPAPAPDPPPPVVPAPTFLFRGVVYAAGPNGQRLGGALVRMIESSLPRNPTLTNSGGAFAFDGVTAGRHFLEVSRAGYQLLEVEVDIVDDSLVIIVTLNRDPAAP